MQNSKHKREVGFTLIEILLVLVVVSMMIYGALLFYQQRTLQSHIDRTAAQMQQILNAALSYYLLNGAWPANIACLQGQGDPTLCKIAFLPAALVSPWGGVAYQTVASTDGALYYVYTTVSTVTAGSAPAIAESIAGSLPISYTSSDPGSATTPPNQTTVCKPTMTSCTVAASVNIPGNNLNNARAINFAGLYRNGGCVPVPQCPVDYQSGYQMTPQIFVVPISVSGFNDSSGSTQNVYPISSFTAYATGPALAASVPSCTNKSSTGSTSCGAISNANPTQQYWRACLQIVTEKGVLDTSSRPDWGDQVTVLAVTRCAVSNENAGSPFTVYQ
jgi:prepilin-type N-terminal cleavage/methylation domain-containing protein